MIDINIFSNQQLFFALSETQLKMLVDAAEVKVCKEGEVVFREGEMGDSIVIIASGKVELLKRKKDGNEAVLANFSKGAFFGEMSLINVEPRSGTIRATEETVVLFLKNTVLGDIFKTERELFIVLLMNICRILSKRLRQANEKLMEK